MANKLEIKTKAKEKKMILNKKIGELTEKDLEDITKIRAAFPDYEVVFKKKAPKKLKITKADILNYVNERGTPEQKDFYQSDGKTFFELRKRFFVDFPEYK